MDSSSAAFGHLTEEMTERYSAQAEVEAAALGKVVSLAGYRDLLREGGGKNRSGRNAISAPTSSTTLPSQIVATT
jgi:aspartate aminotransferase-like enzyme